MPTDEQSDHAILVATVARYDRIVTCGVLGAGLVIAAMYVAFKTFA